MRRSDERGRPPAQTHSAFRHEISHGNVSQACQKTAARKILSYDIRSRRAAVVTHLLCYACFACEITSHVRIIC
jgi:hypothetical protein